ncbi:MAG: phage tail protein [Oceanihabitans sp.]
MKKTITLLSLLICFSYSNTTKAQTEPFIGQITMFAGNFAPQGWAKCDGQLLAISQHSALFSLLGTYYGGDGETTFGLPDFRGRVPIHNGNGPGLPTYFLGQRGGLATTTLTIAHMPAHNHPVNAVSEDGSTASPNGSYPAGTKFLDKEYATSGTIINMNSNMIGSSGGSTPVNNMQPYNTVNFIIALYGVYPSPSKK